MDTKEVIEQGDALLNRIDYMRIYGIEAGTLILERENTIKNFIAALKQSQAKVDEYLALRQSVHELLSALKQSQAKVDAADKVIKIYANEVTDLIERATKYLAEPELDDYAGQLISDLLAALEQSQAKEYLATYAEQENSNE